MSELSDICARLGITLKAKHAGVRTDAGGWHYNAWRVVLTMSGASMSTQYRTGLGIKGGPIVADVIASLMSDALAGGESFEDFCDSFGYDRDSRRAYATWLECKETGVRLRGFLGEVAWQELQGADH